MGMEPSPLIRVPPGRYDAVEVNRRRSMCLATSEGLVVLNRLWERNPPPDAPAMEAVAGRTCSYCAGLVNLGVTRCQNCGAPRGF